MFCRTGILACFLLAGFGCSHKPTGGIVRLAVSRFENLSGDSSLDWTAAALPVVLQTELPGADSTATRTLQGYISTVGGQLRVSAFLMEANKITDNIIVKGSGILPVASEIARRLDPHARPYGTENPEALKLYVEQDFERAIALDPNFGEAYVNWCKHLAAKGDTAGADRVIALARKRGNRIPELDRVRLDVDAAVLHGDRDSQVRALVALTRFMPADADLCGRIGDAQVGRHQYSVAVEWYQRATSLDAPNYLRLNQLAYAQCWAHDLEGARKSLLRYQKLRPQDANPFDSLGDVHYYWGRFADAEKYYLEAYGRDATFLGGGTLLKAAQARLMTGDIAGADQIQQKYLAFRRTAGDPLIGYRQAQWDFACGRRKKALDSLVRLGTSAAWSEAAIWFLETGDRDRAREATARAAAMAHEPASARQAALSAYLAGAKGDERQFPAPLEKVARAYSLLFDRQFAAATPALKELYDQASPADPTPYGVLLAWALIETGRVSEATDLLAPTPLPGTETDPLASVAFPRVFTLRSVTAAKRGLRAEALGYDQLFLKLSGDLPTIWDRKP